MNASPDLYSTTLAQIARCGVLPAAVTVLVEDLDEIHDISEASSRFHAFVEDCGFSHATSLRFPIPGETFEACSYMSTAPTQWLTRYNTQDYVHSDPLIRHAAKTSKAFFWSDMAANVHEDPIIEKFAYERSQFGLNDGLVVPIPGPSPRAGIVSYACRNNLPRDMKPALVLSAHYFYNTITLLHQKKNRHKILLTKRELECLQWAAQGKTDWEIGSILGVDSKTVNYRIEKAKKKIGVPTRVQAVIHAIRHLGI